MVSLSTTTNHFTTTFTQNARHSKKTFLNLFIFKTKMIRTMLSIYYKVLFIVSPHSTFPVIFIADYKSRVNLLSNSEMK